MLFFFSLFQYIYCSQGDRVDPDTTSDSCRISFTIKQALIKSWRLPFLNETHYDLSNTKQTHNKLLCHSVAIHFNITSEIRKIASIARCYSYTSECIQLNWLLHRRTTRKQRGLNAHLVFRAWMSSVSFSFLHCLLNWQLPLAVNHRALFSYSLSSEGYSSNHSKLLYTTFLFVISLLSCGLYL